MNEDLAMLLRFEDAEFLSSDQVREIKRLCFSKSQVVANAAIDLLFRVAKIQDFEFLVSIFKLKSRAADRVEIIECMAKINTHESRAFLRRIASMPKNTLPKYYAIRCLIEIDPVSIPFLSKDFSELRSSFKKSLWVYNQILYRKQPLVYLESLISEQLKNSDSKTKYDWIWLKQELIKE